MTTLPRHRTARERAAQQSAAAAVARAWAHTQPPAEPEPEPWPPSPTAWRARCAAIRAQLDAENPHRCPWRTR